jgi:tRNA (cytidine32/uridine32-2'-O)-methyltransferase
MKFDSIRIVLVATSHPGNIGSTARAMKTMGFSRLYLVTPKKFPHINATEMAAGADDLLDNVVITDSLKDALAGCQLILATSARPRGLSLPGLVPKEAANLIAEKSDETEVALVFGREHAGLTNAELLHCHYHIHIPSTPEFSSLNLSQAVQILVYEVRMQLLAPTSVVKHKSDRLATAAEVEYFFTHLESTLRAINFIKPKNPRRLMVRLRRLFNRAQLEDMEVSILRGILTQIDKIQNK